MRRGARRGTASEAMREVVHLTPGDARRVPWRNGRGSTLELAVWPPGSSFDRGDVGWRISAARVPEPGPFSAFPGYDRVLVVTEGEGLVLSHGDAAPAARVAALVPYRFAGDWPTTAALPDGEVADLNVFTARGRFVADVAVLAGTTASPASFAVGASGDAFVHVLAGRFTARVRGREPVVLAAAESLWARWAREADGDDAVHLDGNASAVAVVVRVLAERG